MPVGRPATPSRVGGREEGLALGALFTLLLITAAWWALALWPVADAPEWLQRTRYVCFGVAESGLPDAGGWIGLVGGPFGMLVIILVGWGSGVRGLIARARTSRAHAATLSLLVLGSVFLFAGAGLRVRQAQAAQQEVELTDGLPPSSYPRQDRPAPPLSLVAQDGRTVRLADFHGRPVLVTFAYAHCTTVCPLVVKHTLDAQAALTAEGARPVVLILTLDPWRDTPSRLASMAASWGLPEHDAFILSGDVSAVEAALDAWQVPRSRNESNGEVTHPALVYIVDGEGRIAFAANGGADMIAALARRL